MYYIIQKRHFGSRIRNLHRNIDYIGIKPDVKAMFPQNYFEPVHAIRKKYQNNSLFNLILDEPLEASIFYEFLILFFNIFILIFYI